MPDRVKVAVLISGGGSNMAALLYASRAPDCPYEIVLVASNNPDASGLALAAAEGLATYVMPHQGLDRAEHDRLMDGAIRQSGAEIVALAGYMRILSAEFVAGWHGRMLNIHPSLLPAYKGLHTHQRALAAGDGQAGCTVHLVTAELDDGPILGQTSVAVMPGDTAELLAARVLIAEHQLYPRCLAALAGQASDPKWLYRKVQALALALPEAEERPSHGSPGWRVGGKYFAHFSDQHHGTPHIAVLVKTSGQDELESLIAASPTAYFRPAYYGAAGWIGIILNQPQVDWDRVAEWLDRSWQSVAPKRLSALRRAADAF